MYSYLSIILFYFILSIKYESNKKKNFKFLLFILIFYFAFKYQMGGDWYNYQLFYESQVSKLSIEKIFLTKQWFEKGYILINYIFYNLNFNYEFFQGIVMGGIIWYIFTFIEKKADNYFFAIALLLTSSFHHYIFEPFIRQIIAIAIFLHALEYINKGKLIKYTLLMVLAAQFHISAYLCIPLYFLRYFKINVKNLIFYMIPAYIIFLIIPILIENISLLSKYQHYFKLDRYTSQRGRGIIIEIIKFLVLYIKVFLISASYKYYDKKNEIIEKLAILFCIHSYFLNRLPISVRFQGYFLIPYMISFSSLSKIYIANYRLKEYMGKILEALLIILLTFSLIKNIYYSKRGQVKYFNYNNYIIKLVTLKIDSKEVERKSLKKYFEESQKAEEETRNQIKKLWEKK